MTTRAHNHERRQSGLTLIELMIAMVIVSIAVAATFALGYSLMNGYRDHRRMMEVERSARVSMEIVADAIRLASAGVPKGEVYDQVGCTTSAIQITNHTDAPDEIEVIHASGGVLTALTSTYSSGATELTVFDGSELSEGDYVLVTNGDIGHFLEIGAVTDGGGGEWTLELPTSTCSAPTFPTGDFPLGTLVIRAAATQFYIEDDAGTGNIPTLMMDPDGNGPDEPEPIAQGIEDMQIAVGVDDNPADGTVVEAAGGSTTDEWHYNAVGDADPPAITTTPWRAIRLTLVGRSVNEVSTQALSIRPAAEDRAAASAADEYRRRILSSTIEIRNLEGSPP